MGTGIQKRGKKKSFLVRTPTPCCAWCDWLPPQLADQSPSHSRTYGNKVKIRKQLLSWKKGKKTKSFIIIFKENGLKKKRKGKKEALGECGRFGWGLWKEGRKEIILFSTSSRWASKNGLLTRKSIMSGIIIIITIIIIIIGFFII